MQTTNGQAAGQERPQTDSSYARARQFDEVLSRYLPSLHRMAFRKLGNAGDAEDAVQEALLSAYKHLDQFNGRAQMSTWLTTIVINAARMQLRRRSQRIQVSLDEQVREEQEYSLSELIADDGPSPEDACRESELRTQFRQLLTQLSPRLRRAFQLHDLDGLTIREAALILGVPSGTVKTQLMRARTKVRQLMRLPIEARFSSAHTSGAVSVTTIKVGAARDRNRRALQQGPALRGQISASLEVNGKVA
jgi:RNA polymerase sigma-70 factor (ECF subfamily)